MKAIWGSWLRGLLALALIAWWPLCLAQTTWWVAVDGEDGPGRGSQQQPLKSWDYVVLQKLVQPGDTINIGCGVYVPDRVDKGVSLDQTSGTPERRLTLQGVCAAQRPLLDCSSLSSRGNKICLSMHQSNWWVVRHLRVTGLVQHGREHNWGILLVDGSHNLIDVVESFGHQGRGITVTNSAHGLAAHNVLRACDAHHNADPGTYDGHGKPSPYGNADGIQVSYLNPGSVGNQVLNCRAWLNSDDGLDLWMSKERVLVVDTWAFLNGFVETPQGLIRGGDGNGFKLGPNPAFEAQHLILRNLAWRNRVRGFDLNWAEYVGDVGEQRLINNTAYDHPVDFSFADPRAHRLINNLSVSCARVGGCISAQPRGVEVANPSRSRGNSWQAAGWMLGASDFESVLEQGALTQARGSDGALPSIRFLVPAQGGQLIDQGRCINPQDLGGDVLTFAGAAPDLGYREVGISTRQCDAAAVPQ